MSDTDIHSCGYYCDRPDCIKAQRDELRDKLFEGQAVKTYSGGKPNYTEPEETFEGWPLHSGVPQRKLDGVAGEVKVQIRTDKEWIRQPSLESLIATGFMPQRKWVGLTDEEIEEGQKQSWVSKQAFESAVWWAMKVLKEKNA